MKLSSTVILVSSLSICNEVHGFIAPFSSTSSNTLQATIDPYTDLIDAISSAADAASNAAQTSEHLASSLSSSSAHSLMTPEAITVAQAKLQLLESNILSSADPHVMAKGIIDALEQSSHAAEHAVTATTLLLDNLAHFDAVLSNSMAMQHSFHLIPPETAEIAQAKLAILIHNLSGATVEDDFLTSFISNIDRKLDALPISASNVLMYGALAVVLAHTQRQAGAQDTIDKVREMMEEGGELDINVLAHDVGLPSNVIAEAEKVVASSVVVELEEPTLVMATIAEEKPVEEKVLLQKKDELIITQPALAADAAPVIPVPPVDDIPIKTLMKAASKDVIKSAKFNAARVVRKKKQVERKVLSSPLARLLAAELNLDLSNLGKGTGKNGKILIDDVRNFHARMEEAKESLAGRGAYFATVST